MTLQDCKTQAEVLAWLHSEDEHGCIRYEMGDDLELGLIRMAEIASEGTRPLFFQRREIERAKAEGRIAGLQEAADRVGAKSCTCSHLIRALIQKESAHD